MRQPLLISGEEITPLSHKINAVTLEQLNNTDLSAVSFFIVPLSSDWNTGYEKLQHIRQHTDLHIYLKPVLFLVTGDTIPQDILQTADNIIKDTEETVEKQLNSWVAKLESINTRIEQLKYLTEAGDSNLVFKVLRFIETRNREFKPKPSPRQQSGFVYPTLLPFFLKDDIGAFEILDFLESQQLVTGTLVCKSYACTHCNCAFLNFFETCTDCHSSNLRSEELIHHFKCAYVGEFSDFDRGNALVCPKCNEQLRQLGVDHDKASVVFHCNSCSHIFQEPRVMTSCYNCGRETEPENQVSRDIRSYSITSIGLNAARYGMDSLLQSILESRLEGIAYDVFEKYLKLEIERIERYKISESSLVLMRIDGIDRIYEKLGRRSTEVFNEMSEALREQLRNSDVFSVRDENVFLILLTETSTQNAKVAITRLEERIVVLLDTNLNMHCTVDKRIQKVEAGIDLNQSIEDLLKAHAG